MRRNALGCWLLQLKCQFLRLVAERLQRLPAVLLLQIEQLQVVLEFIVPPLAVPLQETVLRKYQLLVDEAGRVQRGWELGELPAKLAVAQELVRTLLDGHPLQVILSRVGLVLGTVRQQAHRAAFVDL